jgi:hypothetical protein
MAHTGRRRARLTVVDSVTRCPRFASCHAQAAPMIPAPTR